MSKRREFLEVTECLLPGDSVPPVSRRMPRFIGAKRGPEELGAKRVVLVGCGSVGGRIADDLARAGAGALWLVDPKVYKPESVLTHGITLAEVGLGKAETVARRCKQLHPGMRLFYRRGRAQELPMDAFAEADLVVLAADNLACELDVGERCHRLRRPLLQAAVHGESLTVVLRSFTNHETRSACPRCLFGPGELAALEGEMQFSCEAVTESREPSELPGGPTMSASALCALAASMAGCQILRWAHGLGEPWGDSVLEYNAYTHRSVRAPARSHPDCPCEHAPWNVRAVPRSLRQCTVRDLLSWSGASPSEFATLVIDGFEWAEGAVCNCGTLPPEGRFVPAGQPAAACAGCGASMAADVFLRSPGVSLGRLREAADRTLAALGAAEARTALLRSEGNPILFREPPEENNR